MKPIIYAAATILLPTSALRAATTTYIADFDSAVTGSTLPSPFVENGGGTNNSSIENRGVGDNVLRQTVSATSSGTTASAANTSASIPFTDLGGSNDRDFVISTTFKITSNSILNNSTGSRDRKSVV